jgi:hypothetical protein
VHQHQDEESCMNMTEVTCRFDDKLLGVLHPICGLSFLLDFTFVVGVVLILHLGCSFAGIGELEGVLSLVWVGFELLFGWAFVRVFVFEDMGSPLAFGQLVCTPDASAFATGVLVAAAPGAHKSRPKCS